VPSAEHDPNFYWNVYFKSFDPLSTYQISRGLQDSKEGCPVAAFFADTGERLGTFQGHQGAVVSLDITRVLLTIVTCVCWHARNMQAHGTRLV
jgi:hypothetical protein